MAQDYAKQRQSPPPRRRAARPAATREVADSKSTHWSWYFSGLMSGVILAIAGYLGAMKLDADAAETALVSQGVEGQPESPIYTFYRELANAEVAVDARPEPPVAAASAEDTSAPPPALVDPKPAPVAVAAEPGPDYLLQAGSFQSREDAEKQRARLMLLNLDVRIVPGVVSGRTVYRVHAGPYAGKRNLDQARALLSENDIESMPLLVR